jgi:hypothetical protein
MILSPLVFPAQSLTMVDNIKSQCFQVRPKNDIIENTNTKCGITCFKTMRYLVHD